MRRTSPKSPLQLASLACAGILLTLMGGCNLPGSGGASPRKRNERVNRDLLKTLLEDDSLTPVSDFDEDAYFSELEDLYRDAPRSSVDEPAGVTENWETGPGIEEGPINPFLQFGKRIWIHEETGFVVKPYAYPAGMGELAMMMIKRYGDFPVQAAVLDGAELPDVSVQALDAAVLDLRLNFDSEAYVDPRQPGMSEFSSVTLSDWLFVRAQPEVLLEVENFLNLFTADVRQIEIEAKIVEVTTSDSLDYGIEPIDADTPIFGLPNSGTLVNSIDYSFPNTTSAAEAILGVSAVFSGVEFNALLQLVAGHENVSIISRPKIAVREGGRAEIVNIEQVPFFKIAAISSNGSFSTTLEFMPVGVQMYVVPRIIGENTIILNIDIEVSQVTGTAVSLAQGADASSQIVTIPQISKRIARTIVRLDPGEAVILGGLISERTLERERKIPFLGDIPILGFLFKSHYQVTEQTNVLFFIRPRILQGIDLNPDF